MLVGGIGYLPFNLCGRGTTDVVILQSLTPCTLDLACHLIRLSKLCVPFVKRVDIAEHYTFFFKKIIYFYVHAYE